LQTPSEFEAVGDKTRSSIVVNQAKCPKRSNSRLKGGPAAPMEIDIAEGRELG
jgi:hypothetical protein